MSLVVSLYGTLISPPASAKSSRWGSDHKWLSTLINKLDSPKLTRYFDQKRTEILLRLERYPNYFYHTPEHSLVTAREAVDFVDRYFKQSSSVVHAVTTAFAGLTHDLFNDGTLEKRTYRDPDGAEFSGYFNKRGGHQNEERSAIEFAKLMQGANETVGKKLFTDELIEKGKNAIMGTKVVGFHGEGPIVLERNIHDADPMAQALATADLMHLTQIDLAAMVDEALRVWVEDRIDVQHYLHDKLARKRGGGAMPNDRRYLFDLVRHLEGQQRMVLGEHNRWAHLLNKEGFDQPMKELIRRDYPWLWKHAQGNPSTDDLVHSMDAFNKELRQKLGPIFAQESSHIPALDDLFEGKGYVPVVLSPTRLP